MRDVIYSAVARVCTCARVRQFRRAFSFRGKIACCIYDDCVLLINRITCSTRGVDIKYSSSCRGDFLLVNLDALEVARVTKGPFEPQMISRKILARNICLQRENCDNRRKTYAYGSRIAIESVELAISIFIFETLLFCIFHCQVFISQLAAGCIYNAFCNSMGHLMTLCYIYFFSLCVTRV